jgi:hypothetical protein
VHWGAALGAALYAKARQAESKSIPVVSARNKITLPTKPLATFARVDVDLDDEVEALQPA